MKIDGNAILSGDEFIDLWIRANGEPEGRESIEALAKTVGELYCKVTAMEMRLTALEKSAESAPAPEKKERFKWDYGKVMALYDANWDVEEIVEEMAPMARRDTAKIYVQDIIRKELAKRNDTGRLSETGSEDD